MGPTWGRQDPGGPHVGPMDIAIWAITYRLLGDIAVIGNVYLKTKMLCN